MAVRPSSTHTFRGCKPGGWTPLPLALKAGAAYECFCAVSGSLAAEHWLPPHLCAHPPQLHDCGAATALVLLNLAPSEVHAVRCAALVRGDTRMSPE
jgi:hypothetical protein